MRDLFDFVECKEIHIELYREDLESLISNFYNLGYHSPKDYYATYGYVNNTDKPTIMEVTVHVKNEKMLRDQVVKELLLEYLI